MNYIYFMGSNQKNHCTITSDLYTPFLFSHFKEGVIYSKTAIFCRFMRSKRACGRAIAFRTSSVYFLDNCNWLNIITLN